MGTAAETVRVESADGRFLAWAAFSPASRIRARAWSFDEAQRIDPAFFAAAVERAVRARNASPSRATAWPGAWGESDGLPGLVVDRYGDTLVAQFTSAGTERWKAVLADALLKATGLQILYERSDASVRQLEGLEPATGWLRGEGPTELSIREHGWRLTLTSPKATRPASTSTSATAATASPRPFAGSARARCSTATATPAASPSRRSRAEPRR